MRTVQMATAVVLTFAACGSGGAVRRPGATGQSAATSDQTSPGSAPSSGGGGRVVGLHRRSEVRVVRQALEQVLIGMADRAGRRDSEYFSAGVWRSADDRCWRCNVGPGTAAAVLWRTGSWRRGWLLRLATETFDIAVRDHAKPDGSFGPRLGAETNNGIGTMFFGTELGMAYHELLPTLGAARAARWRLALVRAATYWQSEVAGYVRDGRASDPRVWREPAEPCGRGHPSAPERAPGSYPMCSSFRTATATRLSVWSQLRWLRSSHPFQWWSANAVRDRRVQEGRTV